MQVPPKNYNAAMGVIFGMRAEIDRLRAENARLMDALQMVVSSGYDEASRVFAAEVVARAILAKTEQK